MTTVSRLIDFFTPEHYDLKLSLDRPGRTFTGSVVLTGSHTSSDQPIKVHAKDLTIVSATIDGRSASWQLGENDELSLTADNLTSGNHVVTFEFAGAITDPMHGLYPCYYDHDGVKKELLATQFESHHAREVFPCLDEPGAKATFDLELTTESGVTALSNMPIKSQEASDDSLTTIFETTPRMSTYLLAFVTGELRRKTATSKNGVEVNIYATHAQPAASLDHALDVAARTIDFYDEYFGVPYPLPKSDHVALPDFSAGAMENWGLITYREVALLADPETTGISTKQYTAHVIAHELAHQWFGNLVTMEWWNDLWLNESFATLMSYVSLDALYPEWNMWLDFTFGEDLPALRRDAIDGVQAVQVDVNHPDEISTLFDPAIVYAKGARLMRLVQHYVGDEDFRTGLKHYFTDHAYENTVGDDLWQALGLASGKDVQMMMNTWISQPGYPVVTSVRDGDNVTLSQQQFFVGPHSHSDTLWPIPLDGGEIVPTLLDETSVTFTSASPIRLNSDDSAHFITNYDDESFDHLIASIADGSLDTLGRVQILNEATLLARGGLRSSASLVELLKAYEDETSEQVWTIISIALSELRKFVEDDEEAELALRHLTAALASKQYSRLGWESIDGESEDDTKLRATILSLTLYAEVPEAIEKATRLYNDSPLEALDPELRPLIISTVARHGDAALVDELMKQYRETPSSEIRDDICVGVTSTRVPQKIEELLETIKDSRTIKPQDVAHWYIYLVRANESRDAAWLWLQNNWPWIEKTFGGDKSYDDYPRYSASGLVTAKQLDEFKSFFTPLRTIPALKRAIDMGISEIEGRVELIARDKDAVIKVLLNK